jgi:hypothetical protein
MHAEVHAGRAVNYWILQRLDPDVRFIGGIGAVSELELGEIPLDKAELWDFTTRRDAAMMASRTVLRGSSSETTETIPASQASASS